MGQAPMAVMAFISLMALLAFYGICRPGPAGLVGLGTQNKDLWRLAVM